MTLIHTSNITQESIYDDIQNTLDLILKNSTSTLSDVLLNKISHIDSDFLKYRKNKNITENNLCNILDIEIQNTLDTEYFNFFSTDTQEFIMNNFPNGVQGKLMLKIDDTLRGGYNSNKEFTVVIEGEDSEGGSIYQDVIYNNIEHVKKVCQELSDYHYLGLGIEGGVFESIEIDRPKYSNVSEIDKTTGEKKITKIKNREIITYPLPRKIKKEDSKIIRKRKINKK